MALLGASRGLRRTLTWNLFVPMIVLVLAATAVLSAINYRLVNDRLETRVTHLGESNTKLFQSLLWQLDADTMKVLLHEYVELGAVTGARIFDANGIDIQAGEFVEDNSAFFATFTLYQKRAGSDEQIGTLQLEASRMSVWAEVRARAVEIMLVAATAILGATLLVQFMLDRTLLSPVLRVSEKLKSWSGDWTDLEIDLGRKPKTGPGDELDGLVESIHIMRDHILESQSKLAEYQHRLYRAAEIAGLGYCSFDIETGQYVACDENYAAMYDHSIDEMLELSAFDDIILQRMHPDDVDHALAIGQKMLRGETSEGMFRIAKTSGEFRFVRQIYEPGPKLEGERQLVSTVAQDVTEISRLQATLLEAQKVEAIGKLTGGVAHDFNNLLAIISGNLELLRMEVDTHNAHEFVDTSLSAVESGAKLTRQLLAFARKQPLRPAVLNVAQLIKGSAALLRSSVGESIELEIVADGGLWNAKADSAQLEAAILNLVLNARDAMPKGGKLTIEVGNTRLDSVYALDNEGVSPGQYLCVAVTDTGVGMPPETMARVMEPYFTTKKFGKGTGLGLSMAFGFAKQSGGHLKVYSEVGCGTTVKLYLPRAKDPVGASRREDVGIWGAEYAGFRVFLVEDDDSLRKTYTTQLEKHGCVVHATFDKASSRSLAKQVPEIDVILCDVILPKGKKGPEVVKMLHHFYPGCPVVYMSGFTENSIIHQGQLDDGVIMLQKPFSMADLRLAFKRAIKTS